MGFCGLLWVFVGFSKLLWASVGFYGLFEAFLGFCGLLGAFFFFRGAPLKEAGTPFSVRGKAPSGLWTESYARTWALKLGRGGLSSKDSSAGFFRGRLP